MQQIQNIIEWQKKIKLNSWNCIVVNCKFMTKKYKLKLFIELKDDIWSLLVFEKKQKSRWVFQLLIFKYVLG